MPSIIIWDIWALIIELTSTFHDPVLAWLNDASQGQKPTNPMSLPGFSTLQALCFVLLGCAADNMTAMLFPCTDHPQFTSVHYDLGSNAVHPSHKLSGCVPALTNINHH